MTKRSLFILAFAVFASSCVRVKDLKYLQGSTEYISETDHQTKYIEYRLKSEDVVQIKVFTTSDDQFNFFAQAQEQLGGGNPELSGFVIDDRGYVEIPVIGEVQIQGLTIDEAEDKVGELLEASGLQSPKVVMKLLSFKYTVLGEVRRPGSFHNFTGKVNILDAIAQAGDLTDFADRKNIKIIRYQGNNAKILHLDVLDDDILSNPNFYLQPEDQILVDPMKVKNTQGYRANIGITLSILTSVASLVLLLTRIDNNKN